MAFAIMGGLLVGTILTLIFLPTLYVAWYSLKATRLNQRLRQRCSFQRSDASLLAARIIASRMVAELAQRFRRLSSASAPVRSSGDYDTEKRLARRLRCARPGHDPELLARRYPAYFHLLAAADFLSRCIVRIRNVERKHQISAVMELSPNPEHETLALFVGRLDDEIVSGQGFGDESLGVAGKPARARIFAICPTVGSGMEIRGPAVGKIIVKVNVELLTEKRFGVRDYGRVRFDAARERQGDGKAPGKPTPTPRQETLQAVAEFFPERSHLIAPLWLR
jgi:hypothetical protein